MLTIAWFEIHKRFRQLSTYVYFTLFFAIAFLVVVAAGGAFTGADVVVGGSGGKTWVNSPFVLTTLIGVISYFGMIVMAALMGQAVYQDFHYRTHTLFFTSPISKFAYLGGRYVGTLVVLTFVFSSLAWGAWLGSMMPFVEHDLFGPNRWVAYLQPYWVIVLPNLLFIGAVFFSLAALLRRILPVYVASVIFLIGYLIAGTLAGEVEWKFTAALLDPFGLDAIGYVTQYWTVTERNEQMIPLEGALLWNRLLWLGIAVLVMGWSTWRFRFEHGGERLRVRPSADAIAVSAQPPSAPIAVDGKARDFRAWPRLPATIWLNFKETVKNIYFLVILLAGILFIVLASQTLGAIYGTETYPVTASIVEVVGGSFTLFVLIIITFYSGELVWRERDADMHQICDVLPTPNWLPLASKIVALWLVQSLLMAVVMVSGMAVQAAQGYFHFEPRVYLADLFGIKLFQFLLLSVLAIAVQVIVNHKYLGHFVMVLYYLANAFMARFGFEHKLYDYASHPGYTYSDMNGFGHFLRGIVWFDIYWAFWALLLAIGANLLWVRGTDDSWRMRRKLARARWTRSMRAATALASIGVMTVGAFIYYNTNILNRFETRHAGREVSADYEKTYKHLASIAQPRITDSQVVFDLYPERRGLRAKGTLTLANKTGEPIPTIYVEVPRDLRIHALTIDDSREPTRSDERLGMRAFTLSRPMPPGGLASLTFDLEYESRGFENGEGDTSVVHNGTFFNSGLLPHIGYAAQRELGDEATRRKHGLPPKERMASIDDLQARRNNYISSDADWITLDAVVGTSADQIAIVPGYLQREWVDGDRRYFHYRTEGRILNFYSVLSARYDVRRDRWKGPVAFGKPPTEVSRSDIGTESGAPSGLPNGGGDGTDPFVGRDQEVAIEIYFHRGHEYNVDRMIAAIKASLDYFARNFSPYQHRQVRIIEFPRYASFAQSFPNTIPYSEAVGFIARVKPDDPKDVDYPYYVTAHEIAHQWWAHQVIGGNVRGATVMSEALAQYSALMVMKKEFSEAKMKRFLRYELDRYLMGRGTERKKELPLALNENQGYIHYNKGSLVMYALQDYIGEDRVNQALAKYVRAAGYQEPPYTTSRELIDHLRQVTPADSQHIIEDLFETITLFDNRAIKAHYRELPDGRFEVTLDVKCGKLRADEQGRETDRPLDDLIDVGVFGANEEPLLLEKRRFREKEATMTFIVGQRPEKAGIDPLNKLIDRIPDDNLIRVEVIGQ